MIVTPPVDSAFNLPDASTVAIAVSDDDHAAAPVSFRRLPSVYCPYAASCSVAPGATFATGGSISSAVTVAGGGGDSTVTGTYVKPVNANTESGTAPGIDTKSAAPTSTYRFPTESAFAGMMIRASSRDAACSVPSAGQTRFPLVSSTPTRYCAVWPESVPDHDTVFASFVRQRVFAAGSAIAG